MLKYKTDDPILNTLKKAITFYQEGNLNLKQAIAYSRLNSDGTGTRNLSYKYDMIYQTIQTRPPM